MKYFPLGVGGHVDHGKTSLVKALTQIDTDRLPEEKKRGMSMDIGFAFLDFPQRGLRVEIIDLPGHERYIKNAICGIAPVWGLLLVVDASEGVMPQTVEHLRVAKAFGIRQVLVALTKIDKIDKELLALAKEEVCRCIESEDMQAYGLFPVSVLTGEGLEELKSAIGEYAQMCLIDRSEEFFRFFVDSAFTVKGYGTVVRGSCISGRVKEGDILRLEPVGKVCRVRKMQNHGVFVKEGVAGERLAFNIPELEPQEVKRGYFLVKNLKTSDRLIVRLEGQMPKGVGFLFVGMRELSFSYRHLEEKVYLLKLSEPVPAVRGDRGPLLNSSGRLVGSYEVLHPFPRILSKKFIRENLRLLVEEPHQYLLLERGAEGLSREELYAFYGKPVRIQEAIQIGERLYHSGVLSHLADALRELLKEKKGLLSLAEATSRLKVSPLVIEYLLKVEGRLKVLEGYVIDTLDSSVEELESYRRLLEVLSEGIKEEKELKEYKEYLSLALRRGRVYSLGDHLYVSVEVFEEYVRRLKALGREFSLQDAKSALGLSRKYLIPLLEHMDRLGITRREGDRRVFLRWTS